jgi:hypothetical protein
MSRWRHILWASPQSLSVCPKPTAEKKHDPDPTDDEIKNGNIIPCAGLLSAYALRSRRKAAAKINAQRGTKASPLRNSHSRECDMFLSSRALGHRKSVELFLAHRAEILPPHRRFVVTRKARDGRAVAWVG